MKKDDYFTITGIIFTIVGLMHLWRLVAQVPLTFGSWSVPVWISFLGVVVAFFLAYTGFQLKKKK